MPPFVLRSVHHLTPRRFPGSAVKGKSPARGRAFFVDSSLKKVPKCSQRTKMILPIASMGTARIAPEIPHIQNQKTSAIMTRTGLRVNRLATSIGVTVSPRSNEIQDKAPQEA